MTKMSDIKVHDEHSIAMSPDMQMVSGSRGDNRPGKYASSKPSLDTEQGHAGAQSVIGGARKMSNPTMGGHKKQISGSCGG